MTWVQHSTRAVWALAAIVACGAVSLDPAHAQNTPHSNPLTTFGAVLPPNQEPAVLHVNGRIGRRNTATEAVLDMPMLSSLPQYDIRTQNPWYAGTTTFSGPLLQDVLILVGAQGQQLRITALNDYAVDVPVSDASQFQPILAWKRNGQPMSVRDKGPLFLVYPFDDYPELQNDVYYGRSIWQIRSISVQSKQP